MRQFLLITALILLSVAGYAQIYYVSNDGSNGRSGLSERDAWRTIQYAVDRANETETGFTIEILAGTYRAPNLIIEKPMVIRSSSQGVTVRATADTLFTINTIDSLVVIRDLVLEDTADAAYGIVVTSVNEANIIANTFQGFEQSIQLNNGNFSSIEIEGNTFQASTTDIVVNTTALTLDSLLINDNQFDYPTTSDNLSINNQSDLVVNAEYNWWGSAEALEVAASLSDNVDYSPWLNLGTDDNGPIAGFEGDRTSVRLNQDSPSASGDENNLQTAYETASENTTLVLTGSDQPYPSLLANSLPITLAADAQADTIAIDTVTIALDDPSDSVALANGSLLINDSLALPSGNLRTLDSSQVILGDNIDRVNERSGRLVGNFITTPRDIEQQQSFSLLGTVIGSGDALDSLVINRVNGPNSAIEANDYQSIDTRWIISASNSSTVMRNVVFSWYSESDNGTPFDVDSTAVIWRSTDGGETWESIAEDIASSEAANNLREVSIANLPRFIPTDTLSAIWTVSGINRPLPVILTHFIAFQEESSVHLEWSTASEINSDYFQVERSTDGTDFQRLSRQTAAGDSQQPLTYRYTDEGAASRFAGTLYYRLKMVDFDGSFEYSNITAVALNQRPGLRVYANRTSGEIKLFANWSETRYTVQVTDMLGRVLYQAPLLVSEDTQAYSLPLSSLSNGVYLLRCIGTLDWQTSKFRVE